MRILVAEDEKNLNRILTEALTDEGYSVDPCFDGQEAWDALACAEYDVLVLDIMMPRMDGLTLVRCYPIGYISMLDGGRNDEKIIAIPFSDPSYNKYRDIMDLPDHTFDEMAHFFTVYKALEGKEAVAGDVNGREAAVEIIKSALAHYDECFGNKQ